MKNNNFIDERELQRLLDETTSTKEKVRDIISKSLSKNRLSLEETAVLLNTEDPDLNGMIFEGARKLKRDIYGDRIVLFAPLYIGNNCISDCAYCGFRISNKDAVRKTLSDEELREQIISLVSTGQKRLILVYGEHPMYSADFIAHTIDVVYKTKFEKGEIRRVNINAAPLEINDYGKLKKVGIGTYQIFQETYHLETYEKYHPSGKKSNFLWRLYGLDRAMEAGIDDVGIGALFGLYNWKFEVLGLLSHTIHFEEKFNCGPHTISFPRLKIASNVDIPDRYIVNNYDFKRLVAIIRLAVPYTGMILTAREPAEIRKEVIPLGCSQIDAGTRIEIGGYTKQTYSQELDREQFNIGDSRTLEEVIYELANYGYIPSFCTACYRLGRTGEHFMEFSKPGFIKNYCTPNAILTFKEFLTDYAGEKTKKIGERLIEKKIKTITNKKQKKILIERLKRIENGERDLYF